MPPPVHDMPPPLRLHAKWPVGDAAARSCYAASKESPLGAPEGVPPLVHVGRPRFGSMPNGPEGVLSLVHAGRLRFGAMPNGLGTKKSL
jgi:hypothetical protein